MPASPLPPHERVMWRGRPSWADHALLFVLMAAAAVRGGLAFRSEEWMTAALYAFAITVFLGIGAMFHYAVLYEITTERVRIMSGRKPRTIHEIPFTQIKSIQVRRELLNRLFDIGTIEIQPQHGAVITLKGVPSPEGLHHQVSLRAGLHTKPRAANGA